MLPRHFAPIWSVRQEENGGKAIVSFIVGTDPDIGVRPAGKREVARVGTMFAGRRTRGGTDRAGGNAVVLWLSAPGDCSRL
jgi:hypothetical protein